MSLEKEKRREVAKEKTAHRRSDGMMHERFREREENVRPGWYEPHWEEERDGEKLSELYSQGSAFAEFSVSSAGRGRLVIAGREKNRPDAPTLSGDRKYFRGKRQRREVGHQGHLYTSGREEGESAFSFRPDAYLSPDRILDELSDHREALKQETAENAMPFLALAEDRETLRRLSAEIDRLRAAGLSSETEEKSRERLSHEIAHKEEMERRFLKSLALAGRRARRDEDEMLVRPLIIKEEEEAKGGEDEDEKPEKN